MQHIERVTAAIEREGDGYVALCPEFDIGSQGDSIQEARLNLQEALALFFEAASPGEIAERFHREVYVTQLPSPPRRNHSHVGPCISTHGSQEGGRAGEHHNTADTTGEHKRE
jgi:predicted RNase H-like HicB family nuclease